jgi:hypothetical protein
MLGRLVTLRSQICPLAEYACELEVKLNQSKALISQLQYEVGDQENKTNHLSNCFIPLSPPDLNDNLSSCSAIIDPVDATKKLILDNTQNPLTQSDQNINSSQPPSDIDVENLVRDVKKQLLEMGLSIKDLARSLKISRSYMNDLLCVPLPVKRLHTAKANHYSRLNEWLNHWKSEAIIETALNKSKWSKVLNKIPIFLSKNNISCSYFARKILGVKQAYYFWLVEKLKKRSDLSKWDRVVYRRIVKWTLSTPV